MAGTWLPYARVTSGNVQTVLDATAQNPVGALWGPPVPAGSPLSTVGLGAQPVYKYVYFNTAAAPTAQSAPAPVYWTDTTFTTVSANPAEGNGGTNPAWFLAGFWMPNTTALGSSQTASEWGAEFQQSYGWIQVGGYLASAYLSAGAAANYIYGAATTNWNIAAGTTYTNRVAGTILSVTSNVGAVLLGGASSFWGS